MDEKVISFIDNHFVDPITLDSVAKSVGLSKYYLSRNFKRLTNQGFCEYLNEKRVKAATELLLGTNYTVTEIAMLSGFQSISTFNRIFKEAMGCSPKEYRFRGSRRY